MMFDCSFEDVVGMEATDRVRGEQVVWHRTLHHCAWCWFPSGVAIEMS